MLFSALLVAVGATSVAALAPIDLSGNCNGPKGQIYVCSSGAWNQPDTSCQLQTICLNNECQRLGGIIGGAVGSFGPNPDVYCSLYWREDPTCSLAPAWQGTAPGQKNFYEPDNTVGKPMENQLPGHDISYMRCRPNY